MRRATLLERAVAVAGMVAVWLLLWGNAGPFTILGGVVVAILALTMFPLPSVPFGGRISVAGIVLFAACFLRDLLLASVQVAWLAIRPGRVPASAIIAVPLRAGTDLHITLTAAALSLIPGSLIVEADRARAILYVHVIGVSTAEDVERARAAVIRLETRILHATGVPRTTGAGEPAVPAPAGATAVHVDDMSHVDGAPSTHAAGALATQGAGASARADGASVHRDDATGRVGGRPGSGAARATPGEKAGRRFGAGRDVQARRVTPAAEPVIDTEVRTDEEERA
ncbi:Na+/H+ antiporter subunit E [Catenuloplanes indicus]|uniref:Multisubunit Na+/H+ antiporter MnhE subunit n=1 Tax=Catenuloplanes indicus TaxID=137267 RepID=A0AAE3W7V7_9ACTN|nr:Na+/H+ antiporter subunit E [Catenuloplanes indicus]MDQ0371453.1 multisubunit Na+/H+ antiporter MnhE subunit [Catenuloplanes indicus]